MDIKYKWYEKFWFSWLVLTIFQLSPLFLGVLLQGFFLNGIIGPIGISYPWVIVNMFVPVGFWNFFVSLTSFKGLITFPLLIIFLVFTDKLTKNFGINTTFKKICFNLLILFILTIIIDMLIHGHPCSVEKFFSLFSNVNDSCRPQM